MISGELKSEELEPREAAKRRREKLLMLAVALLFIVTTYFEIRLSSLSSRLPFVNSIFFFGLINFNIVLLMVLVFLIFRNVGKIFLERRRKILGARLKSKLVLSFLGFTIIPTVILFLISSLYINSSFDKWFSIKIQNTLQAALEITDTYYKNISRVAQHLSLQFAHELQDKYALDELNQNMVRRHFKKNSENSAVDGIEFYSAPLEERVLVTPRKNSDFEMPRLALDILNKGFQGDSLSIVQHLGRADLIRAISPVMDKVSGKVFGVISVSFIIPVNLVNRVDEISSVFRDYKDVNPLKYPMKSTYFIILIMMTLLIIFVSIWLGLYLARELTVPLERLVTATRNISQGNLDFEVLNPGNDEIATLTTSFNSMTNELKKHRYEIENTYHALQEKNLYVEAILHNVTAGVVSVDLEGKFLTMNPSAENFLSLKTNEVLGKKIMELNLSSLNPLCELFDEFKETKKAAQKQFFQEGSEEGVHLMASIIPFASGYIFVIDDVSYLSKVQREAAWREVARRIAHEIKNPLTPIKLSAQRLQKKFASNPSAEAVVFKECTDTIIKNVDELRDMVNEFSSFARFPSAKLSMNNLNEAIRETVVLYEEAHRGVYFVFKPEERLPFFEFDRDQLKRAMINLLDNSVAALSSGVGENCSLPKMIQIKTHFNEQLQIAAIDIEDNGPGMIDSVRTRLFEPYFSTKKNGTGLGLAIVKRIISDHSGFIRVSSSPGSGTKFTIELPINFLLIKDGITKEESLSKDEKWPEIFS